MHCLLSLILFALTPVLSSSQIDKFCFERSGLIFTMDQKTGVIRAITEGYQPSISPDGKFIAFTHRSKDENDPKSLVKIRNLETKKERSLQQLSQHMQYGALFSPNRNQLAFNIFINGRWDICLLDVKSEKWQLLSKFTRQKNIFRDIYLCSWTAKGDAIACRDEANIYLIDLNGEVLKTIPLSEMVDMDSIAKDTKFSLSPDKRFLLFSIEGTDFSDPTIVIYDLQKGSLRRTSLQGKNAQWLPSGKEILFTFWDKYLGERQVYLASLDGERHFLLHNAEQISFSFR